MKIDGATTLAQLEIELAKLGITRMSLHRFAKPEMVFVVGQLEGDLEGLSGRSVPASGRGDTVAEAVEDMINGTRKRIAAGLEPFWRHP